jgi:hypothetical protein
MSGENVEAVRRHTEAWNRRDLATWLTSFPSGAEIDWSRSRGQITRLRMFQERADALEAAGLSE